MRSYGHKVWCVPGGRIPLESTGEEPVCTSYDMLCILNATQSDAQVQLTLFYERRDPDGPYELNVQARRTRHVRVNDLIDPHAVPLGVEYSCLLESDVPVIVQFIRQDTSRGGQALMTSMAFPLDEPSREGR